jgi:spermidine/putrescine transport system substrate-binding protein
MWQQFVRIVVATLLALSLGSCDNSSQKGEFAGQELHVLAWVGYEESDIVQPFEKATGAKVLTETFTGADKMFAKISQCPSCYDMVVIDPEYISKLNNAGLLSDLDEKDFDFSSYIAPMKHFQLSWINGKLKAVLVRYGVNALVYNTQHLTAEDVKSYQILFSEKVRGRVGIWDWYLPNMGVFSLMNGNNPPYKLSSNQFSALQGSMYRLQPQVSAFMGTFSDVNAALARGDIWVVPALGEHTAAILGEQHLPIAWTIPKEGGVMWVETLGIPVQAKNRPLAIKYIQYLQKPETLAKLTWRRAYRSNTPSIAAIALLTENQKNLLHVHNPAEATRLVDSLHVRMLPTDDAGKSREQQWQATWQAFKARTLQKP